MSHRLRRWLPAVLAPVVVAGVVAVPAIASAAPPALPARSAQQVLELVARSRTIAGFSGTVEQHSDLGLPELPTSGAGSDSQTSSALNLLSGDHRAEVWAAGRTRTRVAVLDSTAERDVIHDGRSVWLWDSRRNTAAHVVATGTGTAQHAAGSPTTPAEAAQALLSQASGSTDVAVDTARRVAGRAAYTLVLTPRTAATTIGSVRIAVDAVTGLPLDVQVIARGAAAPAFETGFTDIDYTVPAASRFTFTPPPGARVTTKTLRASAAATHRTVPDAKRPSVTGAGWASIVEVPATDVPAGLASNATVERLSTASGAGRVLRTALVNVLLTSDGRVLAGAVPVASLVAAAG